jgi:hypothetical protein
MVEADNMDATKYWTEYLVSIIEKHF